jgi:hypothetical protein
MSPSIIASLRAALAALPPLPPTVAAAAWCLAAAAGALSVGSWLLPWLLTFATFHAPRFKARYARCEWAVVTGGSSGIGFSLCKQLAAQGINVVVLAMPDALLAKAAAELQAVAGPSPHQARPLLIRVETQAGHGAGKPTAKVLDEAADTWAFIARELGVTAAAGGAAAGVGGEA